MPHATQAAFGKDSWQTPRNARTLRAYMALRNQEIGARLRELRGQRPQTAVAEELGVAERTYQNWEAGDTKPAYRNLQRLAEFYGVGEDFILKGEHTEPAETPSPFAGKDAAALEGVLGDVLREINEQLAEQTRVLEEIKAHAAATRGLVAEQQRVRAETEAATRDLLAAVDAANRALLADAQQSAPEPSQPAK